MSQTTTPKSEPAIGPTTYWLVIIEQAVSAVVQGPYATDELRDAAATAYRDGDDEEFPDGLHWLDVDGSGELAIGDYSGGFFVADSEDDDDDADTEPAGG